MKGRLDRSILANDFRQVSMDLPVSFRFRSKQYEGASFNFGGYTFDPIAGGVIEGAGAPTLKYCVIDLPKRRPQEEEDIEVLWHEQWIKFVIRNYDPGHVVATLTLVTPESRG